ncbi:MAG: response regulator [Prolixibacteraceae bacterium]|nr:response regulator [Prolixibacteraceae bacterium]
MSGDQTELLKRAFERERLARKEAEAIIEQKSLEIYYRNEELKELNNSLEQRIAERTSEIERSRKDLQNAKEVAENATKAKSDFLSNMSHEIRTPLNAIIGLSNLLMAKNQNAENRKMLKSLDFSANSLLALINDILDFSKIEAGKISFEQHNFNLKELFYELNNSFSLKAGQKNLQYAEHTDPAIPDYLIGDSLKLNQILSNLLSNALKFTSEGNISIGSKLESRNEDHLVIQFSVSDTGIGIPVDKAHLLFNSFSQTNSSITRKYGGTGLGLSISHKLTELQGGKMWFESVENKGTTFFFTLPFKLGFQEIKTEKQQDNTKLKDKKILLVEDNKINQFVASKILQTVGILVDIAGSGQDAITLTNDIKYDLILMDLHMPDMDGFETVLHIKKMKQLNQNWETPIIAFSADAFSETKEIVLKAGFDDFVSKPIIKEDLILKIVQLIPSTT